MTGFDDKRRYKRYNLNASMVYAYHDSNFFYQARMCNYCKGGMCFRSKNAIAPGSDIYIMMESFPPDTVGDDFYDGYLAEVRWCQKILQEKSEAYEESEAYKVGVQYYQTIIK